MRVHEAVALALVASVEQMVVKSHRVMVANTTTQPPIDSVVRSKCQVEGFHPQAMIAPVERAAGNVHEHRARVMGVTKAVPRIGIVVALLHDVEARILVSAAPTGCP